MNKIKLLLARLCWAYLAQHTKKDMAYSSRVLSVWPNDRKALVVFHANGKQVEGISAIEVKQSIELMRAGFAEVNLTIFAKVAPPAYGLTPDQIKDLLKY